MFKCDLSADRNVNSSISWSDPHVQWNINDITHRSLFTEANVRAAIGGSLYGLVFVGQTELWCALFQKDVKVALNAAVVSKKSKKNKSNVYSTDLISSAWWYHVWKWLELYSEMSDSVWLVSTRSDTKQVQGTFEQCKDSWMGLIGPALETPSWGNENYRIIPSSFPQWHGVLSLSQSGGV